VFTLLNCGLIEIQDISIVRPPQIGEYTYGVWETSKLGRLINKLMNKHNLLKDSWPHNLKTSTFSKQTCA
jgi:hypothetical protein